MFHKNLRAVAALKAIIVEHRGIAESRIVFMASKMLSKATDIQLAAPVGLTLALPEVWTTLSPAQQDKIAEYIKASSSDSTIPIMVLASQHDELEGILMDKVNAFPEEKLIKVVQNTELRSYGIVPAVKMYTNVNNWDNANRVYKNLIAPLVGLLSKEQAEQIIKSPRENNADLLDSIEFQSFLKKLSKQDYITRDEINDLLIAESIPQYQKYTEEGVEVE